MLFRSIERIPSPILFKPIEVSSGKYNIYILLRKNTDNIFKQSKWFDFNIEFQFIYQVDVTEKYKIKTKTKSFSINPKNKQEKLLKPQDLKKAKLKEAQDLQKALLEQLNELINRIDDDKNENANYIYNKLADIEESLYGQYNRLESFLNRSFSDMSLELPDQDYNYKELLSGFHKTNPSITVFIDQKNSKTINLKLL